MFLTPPLSIESRRASRSPDLVGDDYHERKTQFLAKLKKKKRKRGRGRGRGSHPNKRRRSRHHGSNQGQGSAPPSNPQPAISFTPGRTARQEQPAGPPSRPAKIKIFRPSSSCLTEEGYSHFQQYCHGIVFGENNQKRVLGKSVTSRVSFKFTRGGKKKLLIKKPSSRKQQKKSSSVPLPQGEFEKALWRIFSSSEVLMKNKILAKAAIILQKYCSENIIEDEDMTNFQRSVTIEDTSRTRPFPAERGPPPSDSRLQNLSSVRTATVWVLPDAGKDANSPTPVEVSLQDMACTINPRTVEGTVINDSNQLGFLFEVCFFIIAVLRKIPSRDAERLSQKFFDIHDNQFWMYTHLIMGTIRQNTRNTYLKKFSKFIYRTVQSGWFSDHVSLIETIKTKKFPSEPIKAYVSARLSGVKPATLMQDLSALNHMFKSFGSPSLYELDKTLPDFIKSVATTFHKDKSKDAAKPMLMSLILELFDFLESPNYVPPIDIHWTWTFALRTLSWFGPRTKEARNLKFSDIWHAQQGTPDEHLVLIIRDAKTGTVAKPHQKNFIPRFHQNREHCPVATFEWLLNEKHINSKHVFHTTSGKKIKSQDFTSLWRDVFDKFCSHKNIPSSKDYTFYTFRTSLCVYLAVFCDFSYELVSTATRHRGTSTTEKCYVAKGEHIARRTLASRMSNLDHLEIMKNDTPQFLKEML